MELKRKLDSRIVFVVLYFVCFVLYYIFAINLADATDYIVSSHLIIPSIGLVSDVAELSLENNKLNTPDTIVGSYNNVESKTLLIGHSSSVFTKLDDVAVNDSIIYNNYDYTVVSRSIVELESIDMAKLLESSPRDTIVLMTCAGQVFEDGSATHRLILFAVRN